MRDEDYGDGARAKAVHQIVKPLALERTEWSSRFVHDQYAALGQNGSHDLQHLLVGDRA